MKLQPVIAGAITAAICLAAALAWAHGPAKWIMDGGYKDNREWLCCNESDCGRAQPGEIRRISGGWEHVPTGSRLMDGDKGIHRSIDADTWRCIPDGKMNCLFIASGA